MAESSSNALRGDIQGMRAIAVLLVLVYHAGFNFLPGGYIGVDCFFVISGYLITGLLLREVERAGRIDLVGFYGRRIRRLLPAAVLVLLCTTALAAALYSPLEIKQYTPSAILAAVYLSNVWFAKQATDYLAEDTTSNPLLHTWSLGVEEQFYLVWPWLFVLAWRYGDDRTAFRRLWVFMIGLSLASLAGCLYLTDVNRPWAFFGSPLRAWEFGVGALVAIMPTAAIPLARAMANAATFVGLALIGGAALFLGQSTSFPGYYAIPPVVGTALIIAAGRHQPGAIANRMLGNRGFRFVGDISYSVYLWHWPIFVFMRTELGHLNATQSLIGISATVVLAWVTYVCVENPVRASRSLLASARLTLGTGFALTSAAIALVVLLGARAADDLASIEQQRYLAAEDDIPEIYDNDCHVPMNSSHMPACRFGSDTPIHRVVLFGDSHAAQWFPALRRIAEQHDWALLSLTKSACPSIRITVHSNRLARDYYECDAWREKALSLIEQEQPALTIVANASSYIDPTESHVPVADAVWQEAVRETVLFLAKHSTRVVVLRDTPRLPVDGLKCASRAVSRAADPRTACVFDAADPSVEATSDLNRAAAQGIANVHLADPTAVICPGQRCALQLEDGMVTFRDRHHISASFSERVADELFDLLNPLLATDSESRQ